MRSAAHVEVLLATYNGDRFLADQIDSIFAQDYAELSVLARDDGSTDGTVEILNGYAERFPGRFRVLPATPPTGSPKANFLILMRESTARYVCFCDQDDVWLPDKVTSTQKEMAQLEAQCGADRPLLVFTDLRVVDAQLRLKSNSFWKLMKIDPSYIDRLRKLMVQSIVTGCTIMINRQLLELALRMPEDASMHDRWLGLLASSMGKAASLKKPTVLYRQHDRNVVGAGGPASKQMRASVMDRIRTLGKGNTAAEWAIGQHQAEALLRVHGSELSQETIDVLTAFRSCETSSSRLRRLATYLRNGFFHAEFGTSVVQGVNRWTTRDVRRDSKVRGAE